MSVTDQGKGRERRVFESQHSFQCAFFVCQVAVQCDDKDCQARTALVVEVPSKFWASQSRVFGPVVKHSLQYTEFRVPTLNCAGGKGCKAAIAPNASYVCSRLGRFRDKARGPAFESQNVQCSFLVVGTVDSCAVDS
jgi:hypothetical protein